MDLGQTNLDRLLDEFEKRWQAGESPVIFEYLDKVPTQQQAEFCRELIAIDVFHRHKHTPEFDQELYREFGSDAVEFAIDEFARLQPVEDTKTPDRRRRVPNNEQISAGSQIGPYRLEKPIGEGGMGTVWLAEQEQPVRRQVAVKLIRSTLENEESVARFDIERQLLAMLDHPNIAKVFDAGTTENGSPFFVMELVDGIPLNRFCDQTKLGYKIVCGYSSGFARQFNTPTRKVSFIAT